MATESDVMPQVGMLARVRNRVGWIAHVDAHPGHKGDLHLVRVEYLDHHGAAEDNLIWELEPQATAWEPRELPRVDASQPMPAADFHALVRASRWSATTPFLDPAGLKRSEYAAITAPVFGAVEIDDFQLVPLLHALAMPRVSILLGDDTGLGKTIEGGLILHELLIRRRIRRILVLTPASLRLQWQQEMLEKFALRFDMVDREQTQKLRSQLGLYANPWRASSRIITSYHYLKQPDILENFLTTCRDSGVQAQLPWDLLVVDEAHNLMPSNFSGRDSDLAQMLRRITPYFEHKLFLTATPHNGHTRCFSGLLEQLDPVRFSQTSEFEADQRARIPDVLLRRLKKEIIQYDLDAGRVPRFSQRFPKPLPLFFGKAELQLNAAAEEFRKAVKRLIAGKHRQEELAGAFAVEVLSKRLLSCPHTFADSWFRFKQGTEDTTDVLATEVRAAQNAAAEATTDDREMESRNLHAVRTVGAWLRPLLDDLKEEIAEIDHCLAALGLRPGSDAITDPMSDARFDRLCELIDEHVRRDNQWRSDERLIVFTEYKTTLDYLERRLKEKYRGDGALRVLYGSDSSLYEREEIKAAFNDPDDPVRVLIATDVASEGLNLQETARLLLHYEIPWNPSRLEQRNGRLDRHGQARDVFVHHFTSDDDADLRFLGYVVSKVEEIREDLGSVAEVFDAAFQRRFIEMADTDAVIADADEAVKINRGRAQVERVQDFEAGGKALDRLELLRKELDVSPESLRDTMSVALRMEAGRGCLEGPDARGRMRLTDHPRAWQTSVDENLRRRVRYGTGSLLHIVFDPKFFLHTRDGRTVFRPSKDTKLLHLGHPLFRDALAAFARRRYRPGPEGATRWTVARAPLPQGMEALVVLHVEELAVNELRETVHQWIRTVRLPFVAGKLGPELPHLPPSEEAQARPDTSDLAITSARTIWEDASGDLRDWMKRHREQLETVIKASLAVERETALKDEKARFRLRINEVSRQMRENTLEKLRREIDRRERALAQGRLFDDERQRELQFEKANFEEELKIRTERYEELRGYLDREQTRVTERLLPARYTLRPGGVQAFPVAVEIRLPQVGQ